MKRVFGMVEAVFDVLYLVTAFIIGYILIFTGGQNHARLLSGIMAVVLCGGDCFHLIPRVAVIITRREEDLRPALGRGKQITSVSMTVFYLILWQLGRMLYPSAIGFWDYLVLVLAAVRIALCLFPQNRWTQRHPPLRWGIYRNIPFFLLGAAVAVRFFLIRAAVPEMRLMWLAIALSFLCYLPVVLWSAKNPKIGMLMLPKTCAYLWMLAMFL